MSCVQVSQKSTVRNCTECQMYQPTPPVAPLHPWSWPTRPWAQLHLDYAGPFEGKVILIIVDAHSNRIEAHLVPCLLLLSTKCKHCLLSLDFRRPSLLIMDFVSSLPNSKHFSYAMELNISHLHHIICHQTDSPSVLFSW